MMHHLSILLFLGSILSSYSLILPPNVVQANCRRNDPNINSCLLRRSRELLPVFCDGLKYLGLPSFDPLFIDALQFSENKGNIVIDAQMKQIILTGHKSAQINSFTFNPNTMTGEVNMVIPELRMRSDLHAKGTVIAFPIDNHAIYNWLFTKVKFDFTFHLQTVMHQGQEYFQIDKLGLKSYSENGFLQLQSINPMNQATDEMTAAAFNSNPRIAMDALNDFMTRSSSEIYKNCFNYVLQRIPADEILPK